MTELTLRPLRPDDGALIARLREETPDTGRVSFAGRFLYDPYETLMGIHPNTIGVVAELPEYDGLVGSGLLRFGEGQYEGEVRPFAYLNSLNVHPDYRRRGIASALAQWRLQAARERLGADAVIFAGIQAGNEGSFLTAKKWSTQRIDRSTVGVVNVRSTPPAPLAGVEARPVAADDLPEVVRKQNDFYRDFSLYTPYTAESLAAWLAHTLFDIPIHHYYVAARPDGQVVAGIGLITEGLIAPAYMVRMPTALRLANLLLKVVPSDGVMKRIMVRNFWFETPDAGHYLWESVRWLCRDRGTNLMLFYDPTMPFAQALRLPRFSPQTTGSIVLTGPVPMREDRPIYYHM